MPRLRRPVHDAAINPLVIFAWNEILPAAIETLPPLRRELVGYVMGQPGKQRLSYAYAMRTWGLSREQFTVELQSAYSAIRLYLGRHGITNAADLESR